MGIGAAGTARAAMPSGVTASVFSEVSVVETVGRRVPDVINHEPILT